MTTRTIFILILLMLMSNLIQAQGRVTADPEPGVPRALARLRAEHYKDVRYVLSLTLRPGAELLRGHEVISVRLEGAVDQLVLDWRKMPVKEGQPAPRIWDLEANGRKVTDARETNDHLIIPGAYLVKGMNVVTLNFESPILTSGSAVTRYLDREDKSEYIYTLFVPSDASTAFPCFDQPDLKARFRLSILAPEQWKVITNVRLGGNDAIGRGPLPPELGGKGGDSQVYAHWTFPMTEPISTYLFAFAAGPFQEFIDNTSSFPGSIFVRKSKAERARKEIPEVFRLTREGMKFFTGYFDYKFPFEKYDQVVLPEFAYGGMEHAGATFLREESILFPSDPTANDLINRAELIFHELAHQWFGDLVTMRWFDDLWLKEGFANSIAL